ncbi:transglycosylase SLT domain-containing protein [Dyella sp. SG609]|uniref:transglycosylase SLT domain-containing protein n=1 Tax=Dyella sp. SG609 TaxID=2587018 RepID=UPI0014467EF3|nr:transglycosylase SLT domain-containing protein [Dyella sp. SG609]NKJ21698.1 soluble lytic murein transglycosylase [Dyella sp. SG609]
MPVHAAPRRLAPSLLALAAGLLLAGFAHAAEPTDAQRAAFKQAYATAQQGGDAWRAQAQNLADYPLYPYLEAAALTHDLRQLDRAPVDAYLKRYPDLIPASDLRRDYLLELARRKDWTTFQSLYQPGLGDALTCDALQARLAQTQPASAQSGPSTQGAALDFQRDLATLWNKPNLPNACDPVIAAAHDQGLLTAQRLWDRIDRAADASQAGTVAALAAWLPGDDPQAGQRIAMALRDPGGAAAKAGTWPDTPRSRQAAMLALERLARRQSSVADSHWEQLRGHFKFTQEQQRRILSALALFHATDFNDDALQRLASLPPPAQTDATREWRVRVALEQQNWQAALSAIDALTPEQKQDGEWRWFRARALTALGRDDEARKLLAPLSEEPTFFGFMAADELDVPYSICPLTLPPDPPREQALLAHAGLQRAFELYAVGLPRQARREWGKALDGADTATLKLAVDLAYRRGWYDRAVFTFNKGEALRYYEQRFPLASQDGLVPQAEEAGIDPSWAYAILRAESAWAADARSGANARGLMQLLPDTAAMVARRNGLNWAGADSLYDPVTNIVLGTRYLAQMAERFNGAPWLASAAYNAGPARLDQWLAARGTLPPDLFVASMPFKETREYVARVMSFAVIYDWRLNGNATPLASRLTAIGQAYALPDRNTPRRPVSCPAPAAAVAPAEAATVPAPPAGDATNSPSQ